MKNRAPYGSQRKAPSMNVLPNHIKEVRIAKGYRTQKEFAEALGVSEATVSYWEGQLFFPTTQNIRKLCGVLNCKLEDLFDWEV